MLGAVAQRVPLSGSALVCQLSGGIGMFSTATFPTQIIGGLDLMGSNAAMSAGRAIREPNLELAACDRKTCKKSCSFPIILIVLFTIFFFWQKEEFKINSRGYLYETLIKFKNSLRAVFFLLYFFWFPQVELRFHFALKIKNLFKMKRTTQLGICISIPFHTLLAQQISGPIQIHEGRDIFLTAKGEPFFWIARIPHGIIPSDLDLEEKQIYLQNVRVKDSM